MNATVDYSTATPVEIDTELSAIYQRCYTVLDKIAQHAKWIKDYEQGLAKKDAGEGRYLRRKLMAKSTSLVEAATQESMKGGYKVRRFRRGNAEHGKAYLGLKQKPWRKKS